MTIFHSGCAIRPVRQRHPGADLRGAGPRPGCRWNCPRRTGRKQLQRRCLGDQQAAPHNGYQAEIAFLDAVLSFVGSVVPPGHLDSGLTSCAPAALLPAPPLEVWGLGLGCLSPGNATFINPVDQFDAQVRSPRAPALVALVDFASDPSLRHQR